MRRRVLSLVGCVALCACGGPGDSGSQVGGVDKVNAATVCRLELHRQSPTLLIRDGSENVTATPDGFRVTGELLEASGGTDPVATFVCTTDPTATTANLTISGRSAAT